MQDLFSIYFSKTSRGYFIAHVLYLFLTILITQKIIGLFGYHYSYPKNIDMARVLSFILSGQAVAPVVLFLVIATGLHGAARFFYRVYYENKLRKGSLKGFVNDIKEYGVIAKWFEKKDNLCIRGKRFFDLKETVDKIESKGGIWISYYELATTSFYSITIVLVSYDINVILRISLSILCFLLALLFTNSLVMGYAIEEHINEIKNIINHVEENSKSKIHLK